MPMRMPMRMPMHSPTNTREAHAQMAGPLKHSVLLLPDVSCTCEQAVLRLAALWDRQCGVGLARKEQAPPAQCLCCLVRRFENFVCQQTESQDMGMTSNSFNGFRCGGHSHVLVLSLLADTPPGHMH